jgi:hypothetical protein
VKPIVIPGLSRNPAFDFWMPRFAACRRYALAWAAWVAKALWAPCALRATLFERRHLVHTVIVRGEPSTMALTFFRLGFHFLLVFRSEWLTLLPNTVVLSHIAHLAIVKSLHSGKSSAAPGAGAKSRNSVYFTTAGAGCAIRKTQMGRSN